MDIANKLKQVYIMTPEKRQETKQTAKAIFSTTLPCAGAAITSFLAIRNMSKFNSGLAKDEVNITNKAMDQVLNDKTNLGKKGVKINNITEDMLKEHSEKETISDFLSPFVQIAKGKNACYRDGAEPINKNVVVINRQKAPLLGFHELGHAFNSNNSTFWKGMQKISGPLMGLAIVFAMLPAYTKESKPEDGKELTKLQKIKNEIRKKSPILAAASMLPTLAEEGKASIRGYKWAKETLNKDLSKKVAKTYAIAYTTYLSTALAFTTAGYISRRVKDSNKTEN